MALNPNAPAYYPPGLNPNANEFIPAAELQRRANRENNARSFNEMMREINAGRARNLAPSRKNRKSRKNRASRKSRKNRKSRANRR
jgi:hypothetical protein